MLYLSRRLNRNKFAVVDTDDDSEEIIYKKELREAVCKLGLEIRGVRVEMTSDGPHVRSYRPYQDMRYYTTRQTKAKALLGVDIVTFRDEITHVLINGAVAQDGLRLRLSDYCKRMSMGTGIHWFNTEDYKEVIIVLDDKIELYDECKALIYDGLIWDILEVTNEDLVRRLYEFLIARHIDPHGYLIDGDERDAYWCEKLHFKRR